MARYLVLFFVLLFIGCEIQSEQIIKPEKLNFDQIKFDAVSKMLIDESKNNSKVQKLLN